MTHHQQLKDDLTSADLLPANHNDTRTSELPENIKHLWKNRDALPDAFSSLVEDDHKNSPEVLKWKSLFEILDRVTDVFTPTVMTAKKRDEHKDKLKKAILTMWYQYNAEKEAELKNSRNHRIIDYHKKRPQKLTEIFNSDRHKISTILETKNINQEIQDLLDPIVTLIIKITAETALADKTEIPKMEKLLTIAYGLITKVENS